MKTVKDWLAQFNGDPEFAKLSYQQQVEVRSRILPDSLKEDPEFLALDPASRSAVFQRLMFDTPQLEDKQLQEDVVRLAQDFRAEADPRKKQALQDQISKFSSNSRLIADSLLLRVFGAGAEGIMKLVPNLAGPYPVLAQAATGSNPRDMAKASDYFDTQLDPASFAAKASTFIRDASPTIGMLLDFTALLPITGPSSAPVGIGKLVTAAARGAAARATTMTGKFLANVASGASHAALTGAIGVARENAISLLAQAEKDDDAAFTLKKNLKWFAGYYLGDAVFNVMLDTILPVGKAAAHIFAPRGTTKPFLKGATETEINKQILDILGGREVDQALIDQLPHANALRALQANVRVAQNLSASSPEDIFTAVMSHHGYNVRTLNGRVRVYPAMREWDPKEAVASLDFKDVRAAQQWFTQEGVTPGRGMFPAEGPASMTYREFKADFPQATRAEHEALVKAAVENGFVLSPAVRQEYPEFLPLHLRPIKDIEPAQGAYKAELVETLKGKVRNPGSVDALVRLFAPNEDGAFTRERLEAFVRHYGRVVGLKAEDARKLRVMEKADASGIPTLTITTPQGARSFKALGTDEKSVLTAVMVAVDDVMPKELARSAARFGQKLYSSYGESLMNQKLFTPAWVEEAAFAEGYTLAKPTAKSPLYQLLDKEGTPVLSGSIDDIKMGLVRKTVDEDYLKVHLAEEGYVLKQDGNGEYLVLKPGQNEPVAKGPDVETLLTTHPELMPRIPSSLGPQLTIVVPGKRVEIRYQKGVAVGNYQDLLKALDAYSNRRLKSTKVSLHAGKRGYIYADKVSKQLEVQIPDVNYRRYFDSIDDAKAYLNGGYESLTEMTSIAAHKGYLLQPWQGKWLLHSNGMSVVAKDLEEVKTVLRDVPIPEWAPELSGLSEEALIGLVKPPVGSFMPRDWVDHTKTPTGWDIKKQFFQSPADFFENMVKKGGDGKILSHFRTLERARQVVTGADHEASTLIHTIFLDKGGKMMKEERRLFIGEYLRAPDHLKKDVIAARQLTEDELLTASRMRELWDGFKAKYSVDPKIVLENYFPHIEKHVLANPLRQFMEGETDKFLRDVFGPTPPRELDAFFKHVRYSDVLSISMEHDPLRAMLKYVAVGNRQLYMGAPWEEAVRYLRESSDEVLVARMKMYLNDVQGLPQSSTDAIIRRAAIQSMINLGVNEKTGTDMIQNMMSLGYVSALGFNPWKAIRNMLDMFVTVAPRLGLDGNEWISKALNRIRADGKGEIFDRLRSRGILTSGHPVSGGEGLTERGVLGKILKSGMAWYKNSDDLTRAAAYLASEMKWEDAFKRYSAGLEGKGRVVTEDAFTEMSGLVTLPPDLQNHVRGLIREGKWDAAKDSFSTEMVRETLFPYRAGLTPNAFRGTVGKLFGMMGHYPLYYVENVKRGIKYGTTATKIAFGSIFLANSAILYTALQSVGINAQDYLPWNPARFTGGPWYVMMNQALMAFGRGYQGRQARAELFGLGSEDGKITLDPTKGNLFKWIIPGGFELVKIQKATELWNQGDDWGAMVSFLGAAPDPEWLASPSDR